MSLCTEESEFVIGRIVENIWQGCQFRLANSTKCRVRTVAMGLESTLMFWGICVSTTGWRLMITERRGEKQALIEIDHHERSIEYIGGFLGAWNNVGHDYNRILIRKLS